MSSVTEPEEEMSERNSRVRIGETMRESNSSIPNMSEFSPKVFESGDATEKRDSIGSKPVTAKSGKRDGEMSTTLGAYSKFELSAKQKQEIKEAFMACDVEGTGYMSTGDLKIALRALGFEPRKNEIRKIVDKVDRNNTGKLGYNDFLEIIHTKLAEKDSKDEILKAFRLFDRDHTGGITFQNLKQIAIELGEGLNDEEIQEMIEEADLDKDGGVNQEEFFRIMKKTSLY